MLKIMETREPEDPEASKFNVRLHTKFRGDVALRRTVPDVCDFWTDYTPSCSTPSWTCMFEMESYS